MIARMGSSWFVQLGLRPGVVASDAILLVCGFQSSLGVVVEVVVKFRALMVIYSTVPDYHIHCLFLFVPGVGSSLFPRA